MVFVVSAFYGMGLWPAPSSGAAASFCIKAGSGVGVRVDFHRENLGPAPERHSKPAGIGAGYPPLWCPTMALKIKITRGSKRGPPWYVFAFFLRAKKEGGPQAKPEKDENCGLSAHKNAVLLKRRSVARPRPFSAWRKDAKRRLGGAPLSTPDGRPVFLFRKTGGNVDS